MDQRALVLSNLKQIRFVNRTGVALSGEFTCDEKSKDAAMARRAAAVIRYRNPTLVGRLLRELDYALLECAYRGWWTEGLGL